MATNSNYALRVPVSLMSDLKIASERDGVSMNGFIVQAVAEKVAVLRARGLLDELSAEEQGDYLATRAARSDGRPLTAVIGRAGTTDEVLPGDELPEGWLAVPELPLRSTT
ncbi:MAG: hypothetical protein ACRYG8_24370 [Janthinobacterium lividum]